MSKHSRSDEVTVVESPRSESYELCGILIDGKRDLKDSRPRPNLQEPSQS